MCIGAHTPAIFPTIIMAIDVEIIWVKFCNKNPSFLGNNEVSLTPEQIKRMVSTAYKSGYELGHREGRYAEHLEVKSKGSDSDALDMFKHFFNR